MPTKSTTVDPTVEYELLDDLLETAFHTDAGRDVARCTLTMFARWLAAERGRLLMDATPDDCKAWMKHRAGQVQPNGHKLAPRTLAKNHSDLRAVYAAAAKDYTNPLNGRVSPMTHIRMPRVPKFTIKHAASVAEVDKLIGRFDLRTGIGLRNAAMVSMMFRCGLRVGEVADLYLSDIDIEDRRLHLPMTKNDQPRIPPIHPETLTLVKRYLRRRGDHPGPAFESERGGGLPVNAVKNIVKRAAASAGVRQVTPHTLRRGYVVEYLTHGGDVATLMLNGGWESETMIVRYLGDQRAKTAQAASDLVAQRQLTARRRLTVVA